MTPRRIEPLLLPDGRVRRRARDFCLRREIAERRPVGTVKDGRPQRLGFIVPAIDEVPRADAVARGRATGIVACARQDRLRRPFSLVHQQKLVVLAVLDDVEFHRDRRQDGRRIGRLARSPQREKEPMAGGHEIVGVAHRIARPGPGRGGTAKVALEVVAEREVVIDVRVQRSGRNVACVGQAVRLDRIRLARHQADRLLEISDRLVDLADGQVPVPAVAIHARVTRVTGDAVRKNIDGLPIPSQVRGAPAHPDQRVRVVAIVLPRGPGVRELGIHPRFGVRLQRHRCERPAEQGRDAGRLRIRAYDYRGGHQDDGSKQQGERSAHGHHPILQGSGQAAGSRR